MRFYLAYLRSGSSPLHVQRPIQEGDKELGSKLWKEGSVNWTCKDTIHGGGLTGCWGLEMVQLCPPKDPMLGAQPWSIFEKCGLGKSHRTGQIPVGGSC